MFFAAILPQFVTASVGHELLQLVVLGLVFVLIALLSDSVGLRRRNGSELVRAPPRRLELVGGAGGLMMIAVGVRLAFTGRKD